MNGGDHLALNGGAALICAAPRSSDYSDTFPLVPVTDRDLFPIGIRDLDPLEDVLSNLLSFLAPSNFSDQVDTDLIATSELDIIWRHCFSAIPNS